MKVKSFSGFLTGPHIFARELQSRRNYSRKKSVWSKTFKKEFGKKILKALQMLKFIQIWPKF
jgi:hypothetical protein